MIKIDQSINTFTTNGREKLFISDGRQPGIVNLYYKVIENKIIIANLMMMMMTTNPEYITMVEIAIAKSSVAISSAPHDDEDDEDDEDGEDDEVTL